MERTHITRPHRPWRAWVLNAWLIATPVAHATPPVVPGTAGFAGSWLGLTAGLDPGQVSRATWSIQSDGHYVRKTGVETQGTVVGERGRFLLVSGTGVRLLDGSYTVQNAMELTTGGAITARWLRLIPPPIPSSLDPALLGESTETMPSGLRSKRPLDGPLIGVWEGRGSHEGKPAEMVWRIGPDGASSLVVVLTHEGRLEAEGGRLRLLPEDGDPETATYRFLDPDSFELTTDDGTTRWTRRPDEPRMDGPIQEPPRPPGAY
jgi:hypothetical protein